MPDSNPLEARAVCTGTRAKFELFNSGAVGIIGCLNGTPKITPVEINRCYNGKELKAPGLNNTALSYRGYLDSTLGPLPDDTICEAKAYFMDDCGGLGAVTDNFSNGFCTNSYIGPATDKPIGGITRGAAKSFRMDCCKRKGPVGSTVCEPLIGC
jgi:hypothetical protein